ncbi:histidine phosphotransferase [Prochlorococcus sp. MIT 1307]|uniref:histidine phosphotransferase n=1 Tax=Prochlorococcus sp. MIT 1307 TaxID=3096219 RepID=UPI002A75F240|nr:histidine phosphotransferase [Prochlorococcus sp. MIT 1307]
MPFENPQRLTRRRSSAGPVPPRRPLGNGLDGMSPHRQGPRPTFLTLRDHGKVYVADLPNLSDGQLAHIRNEAEEVLTSLERRLSDLERDAANGLGDNDTLIKASTKRDVTLRFIRAIQDEQDHRRNNPALKSAAAESLPRTFLEVARHRLPGSTFDSLLREALEACAQEEQAKDEPPTPTPTQSPPPVKVVPIRSNSNSMPVVVSPDPNLKNTTIA